MAFSTALRASRLASLAKPLRVPGNAGTSRFYPVEQVISTSPAAAHRRNWGLKSQIPAKQKSLYIKTKELHSESGWVPYEPGDSYYLKLKRFAEMGVPLEMIYPHTQETRGNPYHVFYNPVGERPRALSSLSKNQFKDLLKEARSRKGEFLQSLKEPATKSYGDGLDSPSASRSFKWSDSRADFSRLARDFCGLSENTYRRREGKAMVSGLGLSYGVKGVVHNTPEGFRAAHLLNARNVKGQSSIGNTAAVGGFVAGGYIASSRANDPIGKVVVSSASVTGNSIRITTSLPSNKS